jgi:hypothetical protein
MKNLLILFAIILSVNSFAQEPEDDDNFDSVTPIYFLDSIYIKYKITKLSIERSVYDDVDGIADMLYDNNEIRIATDEDLSMLLSDSIARLYKASKEFNSKRQLNNVFNFIDNIAIDSNLNVLFIKVISPCQPCMNSIIDNIMSEKEMTKMLSNGKLKYVYVNYYQTTRNSRYEFIVITAKHWFRRKQIYTLYNEKL